MDLQVILKILRVTAPEPNSVLDAENPLLDKNTCRAVASGFVRLLNISSTSAPRARTALLKNIRSVTAPPPNHQNTDALIPLLLQHYSESATKPYEHFCEGNELDIEAFLSAQMRNIQLTHREDTCNIHLLRALLNIDPSNPYVQFGLKKLLCYNVGENEKRLLLQIWANTINLSSDLTDLIAPHLKFYIERILIEIATIVLSEKDKIFEVLKLNNVVNLIEKCSKSPNCFQICCNVLNSLAMLSNFNENILHLVKTFIENVKLKSDNFITLYDQQLQSLVMLIKLDELIDKENCVSSKVIEKLKDLRSISEKNFIMLMIHNCKYFEYVVNKIR